MVMVMGMGVTYGRLVVVVLVVAVRPEAILLVVVVVAGDARHGADVLEVLGRLADDAVAARLLLQRVLDGLVRVRRAGLVLVLVLMLVLVVHGVLLVAHGGIHRSLLLGFHGWIVHLLARSTGSCRRG